MPFLLVRIIAVWHRPALPQSEPCSTIGDEGLNFCVRNGNRCNTLSIGASKDSVAQRFARSSKNRKKVTLALCSETGLYWSQKVQSLDEGTK